MSRARLRTYASYTPTDAELQQISSAYRNHLHRNVQDAEAWNRFISAEITLQWSVQPNNSSRTNKLANEKFVDRWDRWIGLIADVVFYDVADFFVRRAIRKMCEKSAQYFCALLCHVVLPQSGQVIASDRYYFCEANKIKWIIVRTVVSCANLLSSLLKLIIIAYGQRYYIIIQTASTYVISRTSVFAAAFCTF